MPVRISEPPSLAELPLEVVEQAIDTVKDIFAGAENDAWSAVLLLSGVFNVDSKTYVLLPWSPLYGISKDIGTENYPRRAKEWVLEKMASAVLVLDEKAKELLKIERPVRCPWFLTKGLIPNYYLVLLGS
jgi:hypothetical protein